jgi:hypothetical protein
MIDNPSMSAGPLSPQGPAGTRSRRPRPERESSDMAAMMARVLRAMVRRATAGDLDALYQLHQLSGQVGEAIRDAALGAHEGPGRYSWGEIGRELETSRQNARQRFGRPGED